MALSNQGFRTIAKQPFASKQLLDTLPKITIADSFAPSLGALGLAEAAMAYQIDMSPYSSRPSRDTRNASDSIFRNGGSRSMPHVTRSGSGYVGAIALGVHRS